MKLKRVLKGRAAKVEEGGQHEYVQEGVRARSQARHVLVLSFLFSSFSMSCVPCRVVSLDVSIYVGYPSM